jgi:FAD/FMN-containing dehydrogenase
MMASEEFARGLKRWARQAHGEVSCELHQTLKQALDPIGILNSGKFL